MPTLPSVNASYLAARASVLSVNVGRPTKVASKSGLSGIDKRPVDGPVEVRSPQGRASGLDGDAVCDTKSHGGELQAVYAYAREDLDDWQAELGRALPSGSFGENLTTSGLDVTGARIGELWRIGRDLVLQVTDPRIPCRTFAMWLGQQGWVGRFTARARPGTYLRVVRPGLVRAGDPIAVEHAPRGDGPGHDVPAHEVTVGLAFRALTKEPELLPLLLACPNLTPGTAARARRREPFALSD